MPRRETPFLPDQYYHLYNRGNNRQPIFFERDNYIYFLKGIKKYLRGKVEIIVFCLMPTHDHILARVIPQTSEVSNDISKAMMRLGVSHTKAINKRFDRVGALFQGQFQSKPITAYAHLLTLCAYSHGNPVKDGLAATAEAWEFSNSPEWMGLRKGTLVNHEFIAERFGTPAKYDAFLRKCLKSLFLTTKAPSHKDSKSKKTSCFCVFEASWQGFKTLSEGISQNPRSG